MPVLLDIEDSESEEEIVAIGPGTMRRKSPGEGREWMNGPESTEGTDDRATAKRSTTYVAAKTAVKSRKR